MGNRRYTQISLSDDDEDPSIPASAAEDKRGMNKSRQKMASRSTEKEASSAYSSGSDDSGDDAKPIGDAIRVSGKGRGKREHFAAFEYDGNRFELEDAVLLVPEDTGQKPFVAIIKDIIQNKDGNVKVSGQWFYRPEEAPKKGGGSWQCGDTRELFYSFHCDEVPAESVMHRCAVHFIPLNKQIPGRKQHPGFIVQKVYDAVEKKLWKLTDKDYEDNKQHEIDLLVQKTRARLGELPDVVPVAEQQQSNLAAEDNEGPSSDLTAAPRWRAPKRKNRPSPSPPPPTEHQSMLIRLNAMTADPHRNRCLEHLLQGVQKHICCDAESAVQWPDDAVRALVALEKAVYEAHDSQQHKYSQKMRALMYNLKMNRVLCIRFLNRELLPSQMLNMSPNELREGVTAAEVATHDEPDDPKPVQMTDARCGRCMERRVGLTSIIHGGKRDRYQLECIKCGNSWFASSDEVSTLTTEGMSGAPAFPSNSDDAHRIGGGLGQPSKKASHSSLQPLKSFKHQH